MLQKNGIYVIFLEQTIIRVTFFPRAIHVAARRILVAVIFASVLPLTKKNLPGRGKFAIFVTRYEIRI